jgi:lysophospholipase L1-like esterase
MNWMRSIYGKYRNIVPVVVGLVLAAGLTAALVLARSPTEAPQEPLTIAVVGDQNTAGINNRVVWPTLMAERSGWSVSNYALPKAGFAADGMGGQAFSFQVDRAHAERPQVILLVTGTADTWVPEMEAVRVGAADTLHKVIRNGEQAAVVGPIWYETPVPDGVRHVNQAVREVAAQVDVPFFDALEPPLLTKDLMHADLTGPSDAGQSVIADKIAAWLRTQVLR